MSTIHRTTYTFRDAIDALYSRMKESDSALLPLTDVKRYLNDSHIQILQERYYPFLEDTTEFTTTVDDTTYTLYDSYEITDLFDVSTMGDSSTRPAQVFTASDNYIPKRVSVKLRKRGDLENVTVRAQLYDTAVGAPTTIFENFVVSTSDTVDASVITTSPQGEWVDFYFPYITNSFASGTQYAVAISIVGSPGVSSAVLWVGDKITSFTGGDFFSDITGSGNSDITGAFRVYDSNVSAQDYEGKMGSTISVDNTDYRVYDLSGDLSITNFSKPIYIEVDGQPIEYYDGRGQFDDSKYTITDGQLIMKEWSADKDVIFRYQKRARELTDDDQTFIIPDDYITIVVEFAIYKAKLDLGYDDANVNFGEYMRIKRRMKSYFSKQTMGQYQRIKSPYQPGFDTPNLKYSNYN